MRRPEQSGRITSALPADRARTTRAAQATRAAESTDGRAMPDPARRSEPTGPDRPAHPGGPSVSFGSGGAAALAGAAGTIRPAPRRRPSPSEPALPKTRLWRGDVQGLRAIAVLTVIAEHYGASWLPGGYVGVDVFFVISGYLISQLLFREVHRSGRLSIGGFYARRARRILPAATVVSLTTVVASLVLISTVNALSLLRDAVWATFFGANIRFSRLGTDYFTQGLAKSPLQHYWSLSVEEQFYLVWPLLLVGCVVVTRWVRRRRAGASDAGPDAGPAAGSDADGDRARRLPKVAIAVVLAVVVVASFVYNAVAAPADPTATYFSTPARVWELALGALTALIAPTLASRLTPTVRGTLSLSGVTAIVVACMAFGPATESHAWYYLLPDLGAAAALLAGAAGAGKGHDVAPIRWLGVGPLRVIGDWSYSLYLWHWPLLIIARQHHGPLSDTDKLVLVALTFLLADLTYRFVETPLRRPQRLPKPRALALYPITAAAVCLVCALGSVYGHYRIGDFSNRPAVSLSDYGVADPAAYARAHHFTGDPYVALVRASVTAAHEGFAIPSHLHPDLAHLRQDEPALGACDYTQPGLRTLCPHGDTSAKRTIVVLGNSHGRMWDPAVERIADRDHYRTYYFVKSNCTAADLSVVDVDNSTPIGPWKDCSDWRDWALAQIKRIHPALTIVSSSGPNPLIFLPDGTLVKKDSPDRDAVAVSGFARTLAAVQADSDRVVLIRDVPKNNGDPGPCLTSAGGSLGRCMFKPIPYQEQDSENAVTAAVQLGIKHIDPRPWLCWHQQCPVVIGDYLPYRDQGHLSTSYTAFLAPALGRALGMWH